MPAIRLTDAALRKAINEAVSAGVRRELADSTTPGLRFRPSRDGRGMWSLMTRDQSGRNRRFNLGEYPTLGIAEARAQSGIIRHKVRQEGADPTKERRAAREKAETEATEVVQTLAAVIEAYGRQVGHYLKTWPAAQQRMRLIFGRLFNKDTKMLSRAELQIAADNWPSPGSAGSAVRYLRPVLRWAAKRDLAPAELSLIEQPRPTGKRGRVLSSSELAKILPVLRKSAGVHEAAMMMLLLTATRLNETCGATWRQIEAGTWRIPGDQIKRTRRNQILKDHIIPLSRQAVELIEAQRMAAATKIDAGADQDALIFPSQSGSPLGNWDRVQKRVHRDSETSGWHRHDLRRTAATIMGELGIAPHVVEAALNHADIHSPLAGIYNRARYTKEVGEAFQALADRLEDIERRAAELAEPGFRPDSSATAPVTTRDKRSPAHRSSADRSAEPAHQRRHPHRHDRVSSRPVQDEQPPRLI